jgi:hypothetical protein
MMLARKRETSAVARLPDVAMAIAEAREEISRTDTKAATLLTLATGALAGVLAFAHTRVPMPAAVALWTAAALVTLALAVLLMVVRPRLVNVPRNSGFPDHQWLADAGPDVDCRAWRAWQATQLGLLSALAVSKHRRLRLAVDLLSAALLTLAVATPLAAIRF